MSTTHVHSKGRARDLPFPGSIISATRRRCRLTALEGAAAAWCLDHRITERPGRLVPPEPAIVTAWLGRFRVKAVKGTLDLYQVGPLGVERRWEWRAEFDITRDHDVYLNARAVAHVLGVDAGKQGHRTVVRLIGAGFLAGFEADLVAEYSYGHRGANWNASPHGRRWRIHPDDLARFLLDHPEQYDASRVRGKPWRDLAAEAQRKKRWLKVPEIAARLGCTPNNVRDMLRLGDLQGVLMRDRQAISWYVRPAWLLDLPKGSQPDFLRTIYGRKGLPAERVAHRARVLAARETLQAAADAEAAHLLYEVRDTAGRRRLAAEGAELARRLYPQTDDLFPEPERIDACWRAAAAFLRRHPDDGWDTAAD